MKPVFVNGVIPDPQANPLVSCIHDVFLKATDDLAWLGEGDVVLLKPALNSPDPYPSTTHPLTIRVVAQLLEERGAKVVIGDQSGIEHVLHHPKGVIRGSTRESYVHSGIGSKEDTRFFSFEDGDGKGDFIVTSHRTSRLGRTVFSSSNGRKKPITSSACHR